MVYELYIATIATVVAAIFFGIISAMLAIVNTASNPIEAICHVPGTAVCWHVTVLHCVNRSLPVERAGPVLRPGGGRHLAGTVLPQAPGQRPRQGVQVNTTVLNYGCALSNKDLLVLLFYHPDCIHVLNSIN